MTNKNVGTTTRIPAERSENIYHENGFRRSNNLFIRIPFAMCAVRAAFRRRIDTFRRRRITNRNDLYAGLLFTPRLLPRLIYPVNRHRYVYAHVCVCVCVARGGRSSQKYSRIAFFTLDTNDLSAPTSSEFNPEMFLARVRDRRVRVVVMGSVMVMDVGRT